MLRTANTGILLQSTGKEAVGERVDLLAFALVLGAAVILLVIVVTKLRNRNKRG